MSYFRHQWQFIHSRYQAAAHWCYDVLRDGTLLEDVGREMLEGHTTNGEVGLPLQQVEVFGHQRCRMHQAHCCLCVVLALWRGCVWEG